MSEFKTFDKAKINDDYKPTESENEMRERVYKRRHQMENGPDRVRFMEKYDKWMKQWDTERSSRKDLGIEDWMSNHTSPLTLGVIESALAEIVDQTPQPLILPRGQEDVPKATVMRRIFEYTWEIADGDTELYNVIKDTLITGTSVAQEYYWKDRRIVGEGQEVFDYDDCYMESVNMPDFFVDENARGFTGPFGARDCIRRYIMDINDFRLFFSGAVWDPKGRAKFVKPGGDTNYYQYYQPPQGIDHENQVEVLWYWCKKPDDKLVIVANDIVVRDGPNPYLHKQLPFARAVDVKRPHSFYGKGEAELLESTQSENDVLRRMSLDRNHLDLDKMFIGPQTATLDDEDLIARPHGYIPTDGSSEIKPVEYGDIPRSIELSHKKLEEDALRATGINSLASSIPQGGTATEAAILKETTLKRIRMKMRILEREFLVPLARLRVANIIQFYAEPKLEKIVGQAGTKEYEQQILELQQKGQLEVQNGKMYSKKYKEIRLQDTNFNFDTKGQPYEQQAPGTHFFEARPEFFIPVARGGFDISFKAGSTLPISKPLMQTKAAEMWDRVSQIAMAVPNSYDIVKVTDELIKVNDYDPESWKAQPAQVPQDTQTQGLQDQLSLAIQENNLMMQGKRVPPTPYASPAHTKIHAQFMMSAQWQQIPQGDPRVQNFTDHVTGEMMAQEGRNVSSGQSQGQTPAAPTTPGQGTPNQISSASKVGGPQGGNPNLTATIPALIQGGGQAQQGI